MIAWRRSLFAKYFLSLFTAVAVPVLASGASEAWLGYSEQRARLDELLKVEARLAADRIQDFVDGIRDALGWTVQLGWQPGEDEQHQLDALRLLRYVPAIGSITLTDGDGRERVHVARLGLNRMGMGANLSEDPAVKGARLAKIWYGPVTFEQNSEPYMTLSATGSRASAGVVIGSINLKLIWGVVSGIKVGKTGHAFVLDGNGRLIAHPDLSRVLRGDAGTSAAREFVAANDNAEREPITMTNSDGVRVIAIAAPVRGPDWKVVIEQPLKEAFAPIYATLWRTTALILAGAVFALLLAYGLARSMTRPIRQLEAGVEHIGAGNFDYRIHIATGDELEELGQRINTMAEELAASQKKSERINRLKRFLAPQVAELVENSDDRLLDSQRREIVAIFADLRGFTPFSMRAEPETIMALLREYHSALGSIVTRYGATLTNFAGDGLMVLVNAPVPRPDPAYDALCLAQEMQAVVQPLLLNWEKRGHDIGFGIGLAMGFATIGSIGYEGRLEYTAIGNVVNLASRLCAAAGNGEVLVNAAAAAAVDGRIPLTSLDLISVKGYDGNVPVFALPLGPADADTAFVREAKPRAATVAARPDITGSMPSA